MANGQRQLRPFRSETRQRIQRIAGGALTLGTPQTLEVPRVGFLSGILVTVRGDVTLAGGAMSDLGPWNLLRRLRLETNLGATSIVDVSGYGAFLANNHRTLGVTGTGDTSDAAGRTYRFNTGTDGVLLHYWVPVAMNDGANFSVGMLNLQAPEIRVTLTLDPVADIATVHTGASAPALSYELTYYYYEVPSPHLAKWPPLILHRTLEDSQPISTTGEQIYTVPRQGTVLQLTHLVRLNGARNSADVGMIGLRFNKTDDVYRIPGIQHDFFYMHNHGRVPTTGEFMWDLFHADSVPNMGDMRDAVDSEQLSTFEAVLDIASGATLGVGNNFLVTQRRIVQPLVL